MNKHDAPFNYIGNNIAIDFTNTLIVKDGEIVDLLHKGSDLLQWTTEAGLSIDTKQVSQKDFSDALKLRAALRKIIDAILDDQDVPRTALATINQHLGHFSSQQKLCYNDNEFHLQPTQKELTLSSLLAYIAHEGAALLSSPQAKQIKHCSNSNCILTFVDTSRSRKRRWCSMETCGNRSKVAAHYKKTH